eukprot:GEMP01008720.1.p1 GENE.GEMP01008720.1~~GEMP01008720.1.p1  ORF type:complete len:706 (+),score=85.69 GEMP01008720.1:232-2349(+)
MPPSLFAKKIHLVKLRQDVEVEGRTSIASVKRVLQYSFYVDVSDDTAEPQKREDVLCRRSEAQGISRMSWRTAFRLRAFQCKERAADVLSVLFVPYRKLCNTKASHTIAEIQHVAEIKLNDFLNKFFPVIGPFSFEYRVWNMVLAFLVVYLTFALPYEMATYWRPMGHAYETVAFIIDIVFALDIPINFRTAFIVREEQKVVYKSRAVAIQYLKTWFLFDLVSTIPWESIIPSGAGRDKTMLSFSHVYRLPKLVRVTKVLRVLRSTALYVGVLLTWFSLVTFIHIAACMLMLVLKICTYTNGDTRPECTAYNAGSIYRQAVYVALSFGMGAFGGDTSLITKVIEEGYWNTWCDLVCCCTTFGCVILVACLFANYATFLQKHNLNARKHAERIAELSYEMATYTVPVPLQAQVYAYYDYYYNRKEDMTLVHDKTLSDHLRCQLAYHMFGSFVDKVPWFQKMDVMQRMRICSHLRHVTFLAGDRIISRGDIGHEMYFIQNGEVAVVDDQFDPPTTIAILHSGSYFGEIAILYPNIRRTVTVMSRTVSRLLSITGDGFQDLDSLFEEFQEEASKRLGRREIKRETLQTSASLHDTVDDEIALPTPHVFMGGKQSQSSAIDKFSRLKTDKHIIMRNLDDACTTRLFLYQSNKDNQMLSTAAQSVYELSKVVFALGQKEGIDVDPSTLVKPKILKKASSVNEMDFGDEPT